MRNTMRGGMKSGDIIPIQSGFPLVEDARQHTSNTSNEQLQKALQGKREKLDKNIFDGVVNIYNNLVTRYRLMERMTNNDDDLPGPPSGPDDDLPGPPSGPHPDDD